MNINDIATAERHVRDRVTSSLQGLVQDAEHLLEAAQRSGSDEFNAARDKLERQLLHARYELSSLEQQAAQHVRRAYRVSARAVRDHPYAAAGLAVGACLLIGLASRCVDRGPSSCG